MGFYIYCAQRKNLPGRVRRFIDFAVERLKNSQAFHLPQAELRAAAPRRSRAGAVKRPQAAGACSKLAEGSPP